jgi:protein-disulfide isomerase
VPSSSTRRRLALGGLALSAALVVVVALTLLQPHRGPALLPIPSPVAPGTTSAAGILIPAEGTPLGTAFDRDLGRADDPVRLTVWSDFQCAACKDFTENTLPRLVTTYVVGSRLQIVFRDLAIVGLESPAAATAARCANAQGKFWPYVDVLFANQAAPNTGQLLPARLEAMADAIGLDPNAFDACLPSADVYSQVEAETQQGQARGDGVPLFDFGSVVLSGAQTYDTLAQTVDRLLAAPRSSAAASVLASGASPVGTSSPAESVSAASSP